MEIKIDNNKITIPDGCSVRQEGNVIYFEPKEEEDVKVKRWEDLKGCGVEGYFISVTSSINKSPLMEVESKNKNIARTEAHCQSMLAMAQISQLKPFYGGDITKEELSNDESYKYGIYWSARYKKFCIGKYSEVLSTLITFHTKEQAERFIKHNKDLLRDYFMINIKNKE